MTEDENDARTHARRIKGMLHGVMQHMREDIGKVDDPAAKALFETSAEALGGLIKAYEDFEKKAEPAWQR
jgi:hypothetical protein